MSLSAEAIRRAVRTRRFGRVVYFFPEIQTTMPEAAARAAAGDPEGTLVIADAQTAGRGRQGRAWLSAAGVNLTFSLVLYPTLDRLRGLPIVVSLAVARAVRQVTGLPALIKWPNDLVIADRKFAGILIDSRLQGNRVGQVILGIGLNVNLDVDALPEIAPIATSLRRELGRPVDRVDLLATLLLELETLYDALAEGPPPVAEWTALSATIGRRVEIQSSAGVETGLAESIDAEGALSLRRSDGTASRHLSGDVTLRPVVTPLTD